MIKLSFFQIINNIITVTVIALPEDCPADGPPICVRSPRAVVHIGVVSFGSGPNHQRSIRRSTRHRCLY